MPLFRASIVEIKSGVYKGVHYRIVKPSNKNIPSILVRCPRCGEEGRLVQHGRNGGVSRRPKFRIIHGKKQCTIGSCSEWYDILREIYEAVRGERACPQL